jgi:phage terminase large subunit-like protein
LSDGRVAVKMRYWLPDAALKRYPNRPYDEWRRAGILTVTPGDVTDYNTVREQIYQDYKRDGIRSICYDTKTARETAQILGERGVDVIPLTQGFPLNEAIKRTLSLIVEGNLCHGNEVILSWMASNLVVLTNSSSERKIDKQRSAEKIDGMAAVIMGIEGAVVRRPKAPEYFVGVYGGRG